MLYYVYFVTFFFSCLSFGRLRLPVCHFRAMQFVHIPFVSLTGFPLSSMHHIYITQNNIVGCSVEMYKVCGVIHFLCPFSSQDAARREKEKENRITSEWQFGASTTQKNTHTYNENNHMQLRANPNNVSIALSFYCKYFVVVVASIRSACLICMPLPLS